MIATTGWRNARRTLEKRRTLFFLASTSSVLTYFPAPAFNSTLWPKSPNIKNCCSAVSPVATSTRESCSPVPFFRSLPLRGCVRRYALQRAELCSRSSFLMAFEISQRCGLESRQALFQRCVRIHALNVCLCTVQRMPLFRQLLCPVCALYQVS